MTNPNLPPHDLNAEIAVLGAALITPDAIAAANEARLAPEHFYQPAHQHIWAAITDLAATGKAVDAVTVAANLETRNLLEATGGTATLVDLQAQTPAVTNARHYADIVVDRARLRRLITVARTIIDDAQTTNDTDDAIQRAEQAIYQVTTTTRHRASIPIAELTTPTLDDIDARTANPGAIRGVPTGFADYDQLLSGLQPATLNIVAARPAMGKSSFAASISTHAALNHGHTVAFFTLEMSGIETLKRFLSITGRVNANQIRTGQLDPTQQQQLHATAARLAGTNLYLNESSDLTISALRSEARRIHAHAGRLDLIVIDYLQLLSTTGSNAATREREVAEQSRGLKLLAKELNVPVVCLAQVNRGVENRTDKRPSLADLRESGAIEADADTVTFIYRDEVYHPDSTDRGLAELIVAKHRAGPTGVVKVAFLPQYTSFENLARHSPVSSF